MKYIIDIEDEYTKDWVNDTPMCKELCMPISIPNRQRTYYVSTGFKLEPYTEPDRKAIEDEVWEMARLISYDGGLKLTDLYECYKSSSIQEVMKNHSYQEAKEKYEAWRKQKDEIRVGDELKQITVSGSPTGAKCIVVKTDGDKMNGIGKDGSLIVCSSQVKRWWTKTGRSFPEVVDLLKKMKEGDRS